MPVYERDTLAEKLSWLEIDDFETFVLDATDESRAREIHPSATRECVIVLSGTVLAEFKHGIVTLLRKNWLDVPADGLKLSVIQTTGGNCTAEVMRIAGHWEETTVLGMFQARRDKGVELHYHDADEYWLFYRGRGRGQSEGVEYDVESGDLLATQMGYEHEMFESSGVVEAVALETTLRGQKRPGHLHREEHGDPVPPGGAK